MQPVPETTTPAPGGTPVSNEAPKAPFTITGTAEPVVPPVANAASTPAEVLGSTMGANLGPDVAAATQPAQAPTASPDIQPSPTVVGAPVEATTPLQTASTPEASATPSPTPSEGLDPIPGRDKPGPPKGIENLNTSAPDAAYQAVPGQTVDATSAVSAEPTPDPLAISHDAGIVTLGTETAPISTNSATPSPTPAITENPFGGSASSLGPDVASNSAPQTPEATPLTSGDPARDKMMRELAEALGTQVAPIEEVITRAEAGLNKLSPNSPIIPEYRAGVTQAVAFSLSHSNKSN